MFKVAYLESCLACVFDGHHGGGAAEDAADVGVDLWPLEEVRGRVRDVEPGRRVQRGLAVAVLKVHLQLSLAQQKFPHSFLVISKTMLLKIF